MIKENVQKEKPREKQRKKRVNILRSGNVDKHNHHDCTKPAL